MKKILCLGSATKDIFVRLKETRVVENPGEIQAQRLMVFEFGAKEYADGLVEEIGGSAVNVATGLTLLGRKAFLLARVDRGETGGWILKRAGKRKIKKNYAQKTGAAKSEISVIISDQKNADHIIFRSGDSTDGFDFAKFAEKFREKADWLLVASQKEAWNQRQRAVLDFVKNKKARLAFNPSSFQISRAAHQLADFLPAVDLLFLNKDEAIELVLKLRKKEVQAPEKLLEELLFLGAKNVALTDGAEGAWAANKKETYYLPVKKISSAETVGAGDAFASGFLAAFSQEENLSKALAWGIANSGAVVEKVGATQGLLNLSAIQNRAEKLGPEIQDRRSRED